MATFNQLKTQLPTFAANKTALLDRHKNLIPIVRGYNLEVFVVDNRAGVDVKLTSTTPGGTRTLEDIIVIPTDVLRAIADTIDKIKAYKTTDIDWPF